MIPFSSPRIGDSERDKIVSVLESGWLSRGPCVREFERDIAAYVGVSHAIAVSSGTAALHAALAALEIRPGDEVIAPSLTYIGTAASIRASGASLVLCDVEPDTLCLSARTVRKAMSRNTRAIVAVDLHGAPCNYDDLAECGVPVIADSAQSFGSRTAGGVVGSQAAAHAFSFFPNKSLTTGEGGVVTTQSEALADRIRRFANHGQTRRYCHTEWGFNYRMTDMQAAVGLAQLSRIEETLSDMTRVARAYQRNMGDNPEYRPQGGWSRAYARAWCGYPLVFRSARLRRAVERRLSGTRIEYRRMFPPLHIQPCVAQMRRYARRAYPVSLQLWSQKIDLPSGPTLTDASVATICEVVRDCVRDFQNDSEQI